MASDHRLFQSFETSKQNTLVSGTNIKTINGASLLGGGNVVINPIDPNSVKITGNQAISGVKTIKNPLVQANEMHPGSKASKGWRRVTAVVNTGNTNWTTICSFGTSNLPMYTRFLLLNPGRHYMAEIVFSRSTADALGTVAEIKLKATYAYYANYPAKFRIMDRGTNASATLDMCFTGTMASNETFEIFVLEDFTFADRSVNEFISYPFTASPAFATAVSPNCITLLSNAGVYYLDARLNSGMKYTAVTLYDGSVAQTTTETNVAATG